VSRVQFLALIVAFGVLVTACSGSSSSTVGPAEAADSSDQPATSSVDAEATFRGSTGSDSSSLAALDPDADASVFSMPRIESTAREDVPSALRGNRQDASFPDPLIPLDRIRSGGPPPDGIPPIDEPDFQNAAAVTWLTGVEPVIVLEINGDARAYPIQILTWHEIVNDAVGGVPVTVAYCPLCNSALAYDRRVGERILDFGTSGELFNSSLVMYDRQTESLWTHFDGNAVVGALTGQKLDTFSIQTTSWQNFRDAHPDGLVMSRVTGFSRDYGRNPYMGYDNPEGVPFLFDGEYDPRLLPKDRVIVVRDDTEPAVVVPLDQAFAAGALVFDAFGRELVALVEPGTASPLSGQTVELGYDQGASGVFVNELDGASLALSRTADGFVDDNSGTAFDIFGVATDGSDARLEAVEHLDTFWFAIAAFEPDATILGIDG